MKLIVGLGNPGGEYENTRHNIGFFMIDKYLKYKNLDGYKSKFNGLYVDTIIKNEKVIFLKPQSYMNLSGEVVRKYMDFFKISIDDILIISDDLDLHVGHFKIKEKGSNGGHNGLKNIESCIGSNLYKRIKIGICNDRHIDMKDFVLSKFSKEEISIYENMSLTICEILDAYFCEDFSKIVSKYNKKNR